MYNNFWLEYWNLDHFLSTLTDSFLLNSIVSSLFHLPLFSQQQTLSSPSKRKLKLILSKLKKYTIDLSRTTYNYSFGWREKCGKRKNIINWTWMKRARFERSKGDAKLKVKRERSNRESQKKRKKKEKGKDGKQWLDLQPANNLFFRTNESEREREKNEKETKLGKRLGCVQSKKLLKEKRWLQSTTQMKKGDEKVMS